MTSTFTKMKVGFLGAGKMAQALAKGFTSAGELPISGWRWFMVSVLGLKVVLREQVNYRDSHDQ